MTDQPGGRQKPPTDDRTLLDPLNADELRALREARAKMQAAKGGAVAHQVVLGPETGEDIGDAPTRAMPALPQFENNGASLDKINTGQKPLPGVAPRAPEPSVSRPGAPQQAAASAPSGGIPGAAPQAPGVSPSPGGPPGPGGFGENTLLWMAPPKVPTPAAAPGSTTMGLTGEMPRVAAPKRHLKTAGIIGGVAVLCLGLFFAVGGKKERAIVDLHTNPPKASVKINGKALGNQTPMKLNLVEGTWEIEVSLEGHKTETFSITAEPGSSAQPIRKDVELEPISKEGLMTVSITVQPVGANIELDGTLYDARRNVSVANIDPKAPHKLTIEAGGYKKIVQEIAPGQLKEKYNFVLQEEEKAPAQ